MKENYLYWTFKSDWSTLLPHRTWDPDWESEWWVSTSLWVHAGIAARGRDPGHKKLVKNMESQKQVHDKTHYWSLMLSEARYQCEGMEISTSVRVLHSGKRGWQRKKRTEEHTIKGCSSEGVETFLIWGQNEFSWEYGDVLHFDIWCSFDPLHESINDRLNVAASAAAPGL